MSQDLRILISGLLNTEQSEKDINKQIQRLSNKIDKLKLNVEIGKDILNSLNKLNSSLSKLENKIQINIDTSKANKKLDELKKKYDEINKQSSNQNNNVPPNNKPSSSKPNKPSSGSPSQPASRTVNDLEGNYGDLQKRVNEIKKSASEVTKISVNTEKDINNITKATISYKDAIGRTVQEQYKLVESVKKLNDGTIQKSTNWELTSNKVVDNVEQQNKQLQNLVKQRQKLRKELNVALADGTINQAQFNNFSKNIVSSKDITQLEKVKQAIDSTVNATKQQISADQKLSEAKADFILRMKDLQIQSKLTNTEFGKFAKELNFKKSIEEVKLLNSELSKVTKTTSATPKNKPSLLIGQSSKLTNLSDPNINEKTLSDALRNNGVIEHQKVLAASLNRVTGEWSVTIKENSKQQRVLKGSIDQTNGSIFKQSEAIQDVSARNLGFIQQMNVAIQRTITWATAMTA